MCVLWFFKLHDYNVYIVNEKFILTCIISKIIENKTFHLLLTLKLNDKCIDVDISLDL